MSIEWGPMAQEGMSDFLSYHNDDDTYDYIRRENTCGHIGFEDGPVQSYDIKRGASDEEISKELESLRRVARQCFDEFGHDGGLKRFADAPESELYIVLIDDCVDLDKPIMVNDWSGGINDEWNVFGNWHDTPEHREVWDRRKIPYAEAVKRIKLMEPLPPKIVPDFSIEPRYKENIDVLVKKLVRIDDRDNTPYKLVVAQDGILHELRQWYAVLAAKKIMLLIGGKKPHHVTPVGEYPYYFVIRQCQYDDWNKWHRFLKGHCAKVEDWLGKAYDNFPVGYYDVSKDPDFAHSEQKEFPIKIEYYDAHESGW